MTEQEEDMAGEDMQDMTVIIEGDDYNWQALVRFASTLKLGGKKSFSFIEKSKQS